MSYAVGITNEKLSATGVAVCGTESENQAAPARACDYPAKCIHHNERGTAYQLKHPEPAAEPDYDCEGMPPHN